MNLYERFLWRLFSKDYSLFERYQPFWSDKHKIADSRHSFHNHDLKIGNNAIQVTRNILAMYRNNADWPLLQDYLVCVLRLAPGSEMAKPDAGFGYEK